MVKVKGMGAKAGQKGQQGKRQASTKGGAPRQSINSSALDVPARQYAELLRNPCTGPLVPGPFGDGTGGVITRFETDVLVNSGATETAAFVAFVPGSAQLYTSSIAVPLDTTVFALQAQSNGPGYQFLITGANASAFRCLSACLQAYWPGSENDRSGIIAGGSAPLGMISQAANLTTATLRSALPFVERTPVNYAEYVWRPSNFDTEFFSRASTDTSNVDRRTALVFSAAGLKVATGMRVRLVAVYEWRPTYNDGMPIQTKSNTVSKNTLPQVLASLDAAGDWVYNGILKFGKVVGNVAYGAAKVATLFA